MICLWCSLISGIGGWLFGYDVGKQEIRNIFLPDTGVLVVRVVRGGPAEASGIKRGELITAVNGVRVEDARDLRNELLKYRPGTAVTLTVRGERGDRSVRVFLGTFPGQDLPYLGIYYTARVEEPADL